MLERAFNKYEISFLRDNIGDYLIDGGYSDDWGCSLKFWFCIEGEEKNLLAVRIYSDRRIPKSQWNTALILCNMWNNQMRWPKSCLYVEDSFKSTTGTIQLDHHLDLTGGTTQGLIDNAVSNIIRGGIRFWNWAIQEQDF